jgi:hypothetical protein
MIPKEPTLNPEMRSTLFEEKLVLWKELRSAISHEDDLVNHRSTWLLTFEGFLMGGFFLAQTSILRSDAWPYRRLTELFLLSILLAGLWICTVTAQTISAAYTQVAILRQVWLTLYEEEKWPQFELKQWFPFVNREALATLAQRQPDGSQFPPLHGDFKFGFLGGMTTIPTVLFLVNLLAAASCIPLAIRG